MRKIREEHTDHLGKKHPRQFITVADYDEVAGLLVGAVAIEQSLKSAEQANYIAKIADTENPGNPFRDTEGNESDPAFSTRNEMLGVVLNHFLSQESPLGLAPAVPYLDILSDAQLLALLSIDQMTVDAIRAKAIDVTAMQASIDGYAAPLEAI
ncbi:MAG: hypothetical protein JKX92_06015 [Porticoccaceae bacterium]|nr:hypothetical protein [Porticoccaceae bacterium]